MTDDAHYCPSISVCMPVYNAERYLAEAVESILGQTFGDFEFLIIDDGSTDGSHDILRRYAASDPRLRVVSRPNTGYLIALNEMLASARGEFVARMDADDVALPERFERQAAYLRSHPEVLAVGTRILLIDPEGAPLTEMCTLQTHDDIDRSHLEARMGICHPSVMARAEVLRKVGGYRPEYYTAEDMDLWLRLAEIGRLANLPEVLLKYRQHLQSIGYAQRAKQEEIVWRIRADAWQRRGLSQNLPTVRAGPFGPEPGTLDHLRKWAWWALMSGHVATARKYAIRCYCRQPLALESWRLLYCALRGR
jgi:glycosyltransferase involved in cell wall biosynthesis